MTKVKKILFVPILIVAGILMTAPDIFSQHSTIGPGGCGLGQSNCHAADNDWWKDDDHKFTVESIYEDFDRYSLIADRAGVGADKMMNGSSDCMKCHATVVSGNEADEVEEGVSCESCHGPGGGYKDPHQTGEAKDGYQRTGYLEGLKLGMFEMSNLKVRAEVCVGCHYINDEKLIRAGHPTGDGFGYAKGIRQVSQHWDRESTSKDKDKKPFRKAVEKRGPIPMLAVTAQPRTQTSTASSSGGTARRSPPPPRIIAGDPFFPLKATKKITLGPFPLVSDSASIDEILLILKKRLELIYKQLGKK